MGFCLLAPLEGPLGEERPIRDHTAPHPTQRTRGLVQTTPNSAKHGWAGNLVAPALPNASVQL